MMAGRKPYPFEVMKATNDRNRLTKKELDGRQAHEPKIQSALLRCPAHLSPEAKKEWKRIVKLYREFDAPILNDLDVNALEVYCEALVTYRKAINMVRQTAEVAKFKGDDKQRKNPWLTVANEAAGQIKKYGEILLLDPVSRARVGLAKSKAEDDDDPMLKLLNTPKTGSRDV